MIEWLSQQPMPCLVTVKFSTGIDHCVLVTAVGEEEVRLIDPLSGIVFEGRAGFVERWRGDAIWSN